MKRNGLKRVSGGSFCSIHGFIWIAIALLTMVHAGLPAESASKVRVLILTGESDIPFHDWRSTTPFLKNILEQAGSFDVKAAEEVRGLGKEAFASYDVLVINYSGPRWGEKTESAIEEFVRSGKGLVALHATAYGTFYGMEYRKGKWIYPEGVGSGWKAFPEMVGSSYKQGNVGHSARHAFQVRWTKKDHPICQGLPETFMISDELYHKLDLAPTAEVLATAFSDPKMGGTGKDEPMMWTMAFGQGRVIHLVLGHDTSSMYSEGFMDAFARGCEWSATGRVTLPHPPANTASNAVRALVVTGGHSYPTALYSVFEGMEGIAWKHAVSQTEAFKSDLRDKYDVIVLHDYSEQLGAKEQENLRAFVESGKGVVSTHHAIVDYTNWPWWYEEVVGGKYFTQTAGAHEKSEYKEGVAFVSRPAKGSGGHAITRGIGPIVTRDEAYRKMWFSDKITVLMETDEPLNDRPVVYIGPHPKAKSVYIQLGHEEETLRHPAYLKLVRNAILWAAGKME
jgi:uncharacterized protein